MNNTGYSTLEVFKDIPGVQKDFVKKLHKVITSCKTKEQLSAAGEYIILAGKRGLIDPGVILFYHGIIAGCLSRIEMED